LKLPLTNITPIFDCLFQGALQSDTSNLILSKTLAVIVNKWTDEQILESIYKTIQTNLLPMLKEEDDVHKRKLCFNIFIWLIKALVMRGHPYGFELLDSIIIEQCGTDIGEDAAISFTTLLEDDGFVLNSQANYLLALLYLLQKVPRQVTIHELPKLMMPIIVSLSSHHMNLIILTLKVTQDIIPNAQSIIVQHLGSFIHALLRLTCFPVVDIRLLALKGLLTLAQKGKFDILSPFRPSVVKELASALDDKKRI
ncbi:mms19 nucleotide excision repair, partial [Rhizopus stolonifer]